MINNVHSWWNNHCCVSPYTSSPSPESSVEEGSPPLEPLKPEKTKSVEVLNQQISLLKAKIKELEEADDKTITKMKLKKIEQIVDKEIESLTEEHGDLKLRIEKQGRLFCNIKRNKTTTRLFLIFIGLGISVNLASNVYSVWSTKKTNEEGDCQKIDNVSNIISISLSSGTLILGTAATWLFNVWQFSDNDDSALLIDSSETINRAHQFKEFLMALRQHKKSQKVGSLQSEKTYTACIKLYKPNYMSPEDFHSMCIHYSHEDTKIKKTLKSLKNTKVSVLKSSKEEEASLNVKWGGEKGISDNNDGNQMKHSGSLQLNSDAIENLWVRLDTLSESKESLSYLYIDGVKIERFKA